MKRYGILAIIFLAGLLAGAGMGTWWVGAAQSAEPLIELYADGTWRCKGGGYDCLLAAPSATNTPPAAPTETALPTLTPAPSATPLPAATATPSPTNTATPTPIVTDPPEPTATLEDFRTPSPTPLPTASPTPTSTPQPGKCVVTVTATALNVRQTPGGTIIGQVHYGDTLSPDGYAMLDGVKWYRIYWLPDQSGFVHSGYVAVQPGADCSKLPLVNTPSPTPTLTPAPQTRAAWLIHGLPGINRMELESTYPVLAAAGIGYGIKPYGDPDTCTRALAFGGICIYRFPMLGSDCPILEKDPVAAAREWMVAYENHIRSFLWPYRHTGRAFVELVNECWFGGPADVGPIYWWGTFLDEAATYAITHDWPPVVAPTFGPGDGDSVFQYTVWRSGLQKIADAGGMIGWHDYTPWHNNGLCSCDEWLACRHRRNYEAVLAAGIVGLEYAVTEAARDWGGSSVNEADFVCWYDQIKYDPGLHSVAAWVGGYHPVWAQANLDSHYMALAQKIAALF